MPPFTGQIGTGVGDLDYTQELAGSTYATDWQKFFDEYDWQKETALGEKYQGALGGLFEKAGAGTMDLMSSWRGGGQTLSGRKGRARKALGRGTAYDAFKLGQGFDMSVLGERTAWQGDQRSTLNTLLGSGIFEGGGDYMPSGESPTDTFIPEFDPATGESEGCPVGMIECDNGECATSISNCGGG